MSVSVIIPAYNVGAVIERAVRSALDQTRPVLEIIVVDDGSEDSTGDVVRRLGEAYSQIRLIALENNGGPGRARNAGIAVARGAWIALLDADDTWDRARMATLLAIAEEGGADFVADNLIFYDAAADKIERLAFNVPWHTQVLEVEAMFAGRAPGTSRRVPWGVLQPILRRDFLRANEIAYDETLRVGEDFKFQAEILLSGGKAVLCREPLYTYFQRVGAISGVASPYTRTPPADLGRQLETIEDLKRKYRAAITPAIGRAMKRRISGLNKRHANRTASRLWQAGARWRYALFVFSHPGLVTFLLRKLPDRARLSMRRLVHRVARGFPAPPG